jgi:hypothetical protein
LGVVSVFKRLEAVSPVSPPPPPNLTPFAPALPPPTFPKKTKGVPGPGVLRLGVPQGRAGRRGLLHGGQRPQLRGDPRYGGRRGQGDAAPPPAPGGREGRGCRLTRCVACARLGYFRTLCGASMLQATQTNLTHPTAPAPAVHPTVHPAPHPRSSTLTSRCATCCSRATGRRGAAWWQKVSEDWI